MLLQLFYESFLKLFAIIKPKNPIRSIPKADWQLARKKFTISVIASFGPSELLKLYDIAASRPSLEWL